MRSEQVMLDLIISTAKEDDRIRAVIMNGSRVDPNAPRDIFQDFDIVYYVTEVESFVDDPAWIDRFGELMILQLPEAMDDPPPDNDGHWMYLMQFADGNRLDLALEPIANWQADAAPDSLSLLLLDKDGLLPPFPPPSDRDYLPSPPTAKAFADCCNEFWWLGPNIAKGLWRDELPYARHMFDNFAREQLMKMLAWTVGIKTGFSGNPGKFGKYLQRTLEPELWAMLLQTYAEGGYEQTWDALFVMGDLFRRTARQVAAQFDFDYPREDDEKASAHLHHVRALPKNATEMY